MAETVLVLTTKDATGLLAMSEAIALTEEAFRDFGRNRAQVLPRRRLTLPQPDETEPRWFWMNVIPGAVPCHGVAALRGRCADRLSVPWRQPASSIPRRRLRLRAGLGLGDPGAPRHRA
jgi:hypothetical protein